MSEKATRAAWLAVGVVVFALALKRAGSTPPPAPFRVEATLPASPEEPLFEVGFASSGASPSVHSATAVELEDGRIRAFWYGGSREGAKDVAIFSAVFDPDEGAWSREAPVVTREQTQRDLRRHIKKLGNPVVSRDGDGRLWLFYVSVSVGGWSGSAINAKVSDDEGESWSRAKRLVTSPFLNISTLVKGPAVLYQDGTQGLPVYHEFLGKFGELLRLDENGRVLGKTRLTWGRSSLQPVVVPFTGEHAVALMRKSGRSIPRILSAETTDSGLYWTAVTPTPVNNPDAAIAAVRARTGEVLLAFNDSENNRSNLSLALSGNRGDSWETVHVFDPPAPSDDARFAYPWLVQTASGEFHLLYTWNRSRIVHVRFNRAWLWRNR